MRTCLSSQLRSLSGKQGTASLGKTEELPRPQRGLPIFGSLGGSAGEAAGGWLGGLFGS